MTETEQMQDFQDQLGQGEPGTMSIRKCGACASAHWYPRQKCPICHSFDTRWERCSDAGEIYSYTIMRRSAGEPYGVACVTLDVGPRVFVKFGPALFDGMHIGLRVRVKLSPNDGDGSLRLNEADVA